MAMMNSFSLLKQYIWDSSQKPMKEDAFDPKVHLNYTPPSKKFTMQELLLRQSPAASPIAATVPFPLLSAEGVKAYRTALFQEDVINKCARTLILSDAVKQSKFINDFWTHPETMKIVSEAVGVPLEVVMPTEIGHTNIQVEGTTIAHMASNLKVEPVVEKAKLSDEERSYDPLKDDSAIIPWHYDSYPYVCVLMLSDTDGMIGGETYIKQGDGEVQKIEGPQIGYAVMLQGGEVCHLAARAKGVKERISTITSYRSKMPNVYDSSYITNVRPYADTNSLYPEWTQYRLRKLRDELTHHLDLMEKEEDPVQARKNIQKLVDQQIDYLQRTSRQMVDPEYTQQVLRKYGRPAYYDAPRVWETVQSLPGFERLASAADEERRWQPENIYWMDLLRSIETIRLGKPLHSALGTAV
ncbi:Pc21g01070 [Penicillium rubens Wisconsin 54-1255]|uniref:Pc21g01070 protein n=1 Tax=Penicillium rubens (strain ATCC 28089 / DSM 1075 / NRRL 1951 / Wisconsin 54-1255) TaxID=500485 RepID=B6HHX5_PENRW|nr:Pc21g01070 [Penicillium rubens Wisconsin 54-1255]